MPEAQQRHGLASQMFCDQCAVQLRSQMFQAGSFSYKWLLCETHTVLKKQLKAEKQELMLVAGAIAGLASALSVCKVCASAVLPSTIG